MRSSSEGGQATVEAAFMLPMLLAVFGLFLEPSILFYDRAVMEAAAAETCRVVETQTAEESAVEAYALRRLGAVPSLSVFHMGGDAGWTVELEGGELEEVTVTVTHRVSPLPLLGVTAGLGGSMQGDGSCLQSVSATSALAPSWAAELGSSPEEWVEGWE